MPPRDLHPSIDLTTIEGVSRREVLLGALVLPLIAAISCGDDDDAAPAPGATRQFTDSTGTTVEVPATPRRIVTVGAPQWGAAQVLSLGMPLVGAGNFEGTVWPDYIANYFDMDGIAGVGWAEETDIEAILALDPDLIVAQARDGVADTSTAVDFEQLRPIAPVVAIDPFRPVDEVMADFVELLGVDPAVLNQQQREYEDIFGQMKALLGNDWADVTAASCWAGQDAAEAWGPTDLPMNAIINDLGVAWVQPVRDAADEGGYLAVSLERLSGFDCDLMLYGNTYGDLRGNPLFDGLKVVQAGQLISFPDFTYDGTHYPNYIACAGHILEQLRAMGEIRTDIV